MQSDVTAKVNDTEHVLRKRPATREHRCVTVENRADAARIIRERRKELELTQIELAGRADVGNSSIQRLEQGKRIDSSVERKIAQALLWSAGSIDLVFGGGEPVLLSEEAAHDRAWSESFISDVLDMSHEEMARRAAFVAAVHGDPSEGDRLMAAMLRIRSERRVDRHAETGS